MSINQETSPPVRLAHNLDEVAFLLDVSRRTVERLVESGVLQSVPMGRSRRVPRRIIDEYLEARLKGAA